MQREVRKMGHKILHEIETGSDHYESRKANTQPVPFMSGLYL